MNLRVSFILMIILFVTGCANGSLVTSKLAADSSVNKGIIYYLPKQHIKVVYKRKPVKYSDAKKKYKTVKEQVAKINAKKKEKSNEISELKAFIKSLDKNAAGYSVLNSKKEVELLGLKTELLAITSELIKSKETLSEAEKELLNAMDSGVTISDSLTLKATDVMPDSNYKFVAEVKHDKQFTDKITINLKDSLLDGALGTSEGKSNEIVSTIVSGFSGLKTARTNSIFMAFNQNKGLQNQKSSKDVCPNSFEISRTINPDNAIERRKLNDALKPCIKLEILRPSPMVEIENSNNEPTSTISENGNQGKTNTSEAEYDGLLYRQPAAYKVKVYSFEAEGSINHVKTEYIVLAQGGDLGVISFPKSSFAKNEYDIGFSKGALTKADYTFPSEVLGFLSILPNALKALFEIPTELIQFKVDYSSYESKIAEQEVTLTKALIELDKQQALLEADLNNPDD